MFYPNFCNFCIQLYLCLFAAEKEKETIYEGINELASVLHCVDFIIWDQDAEPTGDYVFIKRNDDQGCTSYVGKIRRGRQVSTCRVGFTVRGNWISFDEPRYFIGKMCTLCKAIFRI